MFKKIALAFLLVVATTSVSSATDAKVAVINMQKIMDESTAAKDLQAQLEAKRSSYQASIKAKEEKLRKEEEDLVKQKNILAKDALEQKQKEFIAEINKVRKEVQDKRVALDNAYKQALNELNKAILQIVSDMAEEKGFNLAFPHSALVYASSDFDITADVITQLNKKLPKVTLKF
jgi:Skp family chaperone for outer membrane proteins